MFFLAISSIKKGDPSFAYAYQKKIDSGKNKSQALGFISHKLLNVVFTVLKNNIDYVPIFPPDVDVSKLAEKAMKSQLPISLVNKGFCKPLPLGGGGC